MKSTLNTVAMVILMSAFAPAQARAQQAGTATFYNLNSTLTSDGFEKMTAELGSLLRFRQLGDSTPIGRGKVDLGVQFGNAPADDFNAPRLGARFGVTPRADVGVWGGLNTGNRYGLAGVDVKLMLLEQRRGQPISVSVRPSITSLIGGDVWAGTTGIDLTVSRAFGALAPYAGIAGTSTIAFERSDAVTLGHATANASLSYAGVACRWRALVLAGEVEHGAKTHYAVRVGTRF